MWGHTHPNTTTVGGLHHVPPIDRPSQGIKELSEIKHPESNGLNRHRQNPTNEKETFSYQLREFSPE